LTLIKRRKKGKKEKKIPEKRMMTKRMTRRRMTRRRMVTRRMRRKRGRRVRRYPEKSVCRSGLFCQRGARDLVGQSLPCIGPRAVGLVRKANHRMCKTRSGNSLFVLKNSTSGHCV
jgi:hypothetical protein